MESGFIPQGIRDALTVFTVLVSIATLFQIIRIRSALAFFRRLNTQSATYEDIVFAGAITVAAGFLILTAIWLVFAVLNSLEIDKPARFAVAFGAAISLLCGVGLGSLVKLTGRGRVPIPIHITIVGTTIASAYLLGWLVWPDRALWFLDLVRLVAVALVVLSVLLAYVAQTKPWNVPRPTNP